MIQVKDLSFTYWGQEKETLKKISFEIGAGEIWLLCGPSGSGKSTLLKLLKEEIRPAGKLTGSLALAVKGTQIGFVGQNPDLQIVTGKVWQELAFGLENQHMSNGQIHKKVAEISEYFGISSWFFQDTDALSGGQKQLLNLASVMAMEPEILLLDEPGAQLDPIAYERFLDILRQLNRDFGTTVILAEHRLEKSLSLADGLLFLEEGAQAACGAVQEEIAGLYEKKSRLTVLLPPQVQIFYGIENSLEFPCKENDQGTLFSHGNRGVCPLTEGAGRQWITRRSCGKAWQAPAENVEKGEVVLQAKGLTFSYEKAPLLKDLDLKVKKGEFYAVLGGNGAGKTTLLKLLSGLIRPSDGKIKRKGKLCGVSQNPQAGFTEPTVEDELAVMGAGREEMETMLLRLELSEVRKNHPYDLSGGQMQRLALGKALLLKPDILLLDEPTKGLDAIFRQRLGEFLSALSLTIVMVSHDIEFCARFASRGALLFGGQLVAEGSMRQLLAQNRFYTTAVGKMAGARFPGMLLTEECLQALENGGRNEP